MIGLVTYFEAAVGRHRPKGLLDAAASPVVHAAAARRRRQSGNGRHGEDGHRGGNDAELQSISDDEDILEVASGTTDEMMIALGETSPAPSYSRGRRRASTQPRA